MGANAARAAARCSSLCCCCCCSCCSSCSWVRLGGQGALPLSAAGEWLRSFGSQILAGDCPKSSPSSPLLPSTLRCSSRLPEARSPDNALSSSPASVPVINKDWTIELLSPVVGVVLVCIYTSECLHTGAIYIRVPGAIYIRETGAIYIRVFAHRCKHHVLRKCKHGQNGVCLHRA